MQGPGRNLLCNSHNTTPMSDTEQSTSIRTMNSGDSTASHTAPAKHPYFCIENEMVAIQVENTLFNVHKQQLYHSETFKDMFGVKHTDMVAQGSTLDDPIKLLGISAMDFESLLITLYAHHCPTWVLALQVVTTDSFDPRHIIPAFRLAEMWNFTSLCTHLTKLAEQKLDTVERAVFAREFGFGDLLEQAYLGLCQRDEPLTSKEASIVLAASVGEGPRPRNSEPAKNTRCQNFRGLYQPRGS
ncbi:hypothetical protein FS749_000001 [Ceratobasidium sp. UAMH 11750]|nr:hypothetical protein FS749_000001 [Ceratobasidium sp. UAMH 11750]